jgi:hypothetical protein
MEPCKAFFLQVKPNFVSHLKLIWNLMLIVLLLVLDIRILYNILNLLVDVMDMLTEPSVFIIFLWSRGQVIRGGHQG